MTPPLILLASASPRRSELLRQVGIAHEVRPVDVDESSRPGEAPAEYVRRLAEEKARALWDSLPAAGRLPVLAADTTVALEGEIFGKPGNRAESIAMLARLSGRTHQVHTAVAVLHAGGSAVRVSSSSVTMREITHAEMDWTRAPVSRATRQAAMRCRGAPRSSSGTLPEATPASSACHSARPGSC